jgi:hypothetical protein
MNISEHFQAVGTGAVGAGLVQVAGAIPSPDEISTLGQIVIQIAIGLATVWRILKKDRKKNRPEDNGE